MEKNTRSYFEANFLSKSNQKRFKKFMISSSFALLILLHPPVAYGQGSSEVDSTSTESNPEDEAPQTEITQPNPVGSTADEWVTYFADHVGISRSYARSIALCESHLDPTQRNRSGASGFWQIMPSQPHRQYFINHGYDFDRDWDNGAANTLAAVDVAHDEGIRAWNCA